MTHVADRPFHSHPSPCKHVLSLSKGRKERVTLASNDLYAIAVGAAPFSSRVEIKMMGYMINSINLFADIDICVWEYMLFPLGPALIGQ
jgi:hypothetical protein